MEKTKEKWRSLNEEKCTWNNINSSSNNNIVLLILAGVSIAMLTGQNGILTQAQNAKNNNRE